MGKDAGEDGEGCNTTGMCLMEAGQRNLGVTWGHGSRIVLSWTQKSPGAFHPCAVGPHVQGMEEEEGKHQHLSVRGRWNLQLTA